MVTNNYGVILYHLRDIASYWSKITKFLYSTCMTPSEFREDVWYL